MDECEIRGIRCPFRSECKNSWRSVYDCVCAKGFKSFEEKEKLKKCPGKRSFDVSLCFAFAFFFINFTVSLIDIDGCLTGESSCSGSRCRNAEGSYQCIPCLPGFIENRDGDCVGRYA